MKKDKNEWLEYLKGKYTAPLAVSDTKKVNRIKRVSSKQIRAIRSEE